MYGWKFSPTSVVFLLPVLTVALVTLVCLFLAIDHIRTNPAAAFDPTDPISIILSVAKSDERLRSALQALGGEGAEVLTKKQLEDIKDLRVMFRRGGLSND